MTPLHLAIKRNSPIIVKLLISERHEQQADPNIVNRFGQTPLHLAASVGYVEIVRLLLLSNLSERCDPTIVDSNQMTVYQVAKANHQETCAKLIEEYEEQWAKHSPRKMLSTSTNEHSSMKAVSTISMHPAQNLENDHDDTSDDSTSITDSRRSKPSPRRTKRSSDDWSDDNNLPTSRSQPEFHSIAGLLKTNPVQPRVRIADTPKKEFPALSSLINTNPVQGDNKKNSLVNSEPSVLNSLVKNNPLQSENESSIVHSLMKNNSLLPGMKNVLHKLYQQISILILMHLKVILNFNSINI